jgi:amino acid adenylation domain-containing protein
MASIDKEWVSIVGALRRWATQSASKIALIYEALGSQGQPEPGVALNYGELDEQARRVAVSLQQQQLSGKPVLVLSQGLPFVVSLLGCFYAGAIAVPCNQPRPQAKHWQRIRGIIANVEAAAVIGEFQYLSSLSNDDHDIPELSQLPLLALEHLLQGDAEQWQESDFDADQLALIQYTSGSTGQPKGVMVSHANLSDNLRMIGQATLADHDSTMVSWLPLFHDMGLMGGLLSPLFLGGRSVLMPPQDFIQQPARWLSLISKYRATTSGGPNFAYAYAAERIHDDALAGLDLSSWRAAFCGAEPVIPATLEQFIERFAEYGFKADSLLPCYGMAECTLMVSGRTGDPRNMTLSASRKALGLGHFEVAHQRSDTQPLTSCGDANEYLEVVIVDPQSGQQLADEQVGEVWIRGQSVAQGYWRDERATQARFKARLSANPQAQCMGNEQVDYLRSGDLGFIRHGALVITGRLKDLIIIRGRNYYPPDLETGIGHQVKGLSRHGVAVLGVESQAFRERQNQQQDSAIAQVLSRAASVGALQSEHLVVVAELDRHAQHVDYPAVFSCIREILVEQHEVMADDIVLIAPGSILRTTSGKLRRRDLVQQYLRGELTVVASMRQGAASTAAGIDLSYLSEAAIPAEENTEENTDEPMPSMALLQQCVATTLQLSVSDLELDQPLTRLGMDSLRAAMLSAEIENQMGQHISISELLHAHDLQELHRCLQAIEEADHEADKQVLPSREFSLRSHDELRHQPFALTDMQQAYWLGRGDLFELGQRSLHAYLEFEGDIDIARFQWAWNQLISKHDMLRAVIDSEGRQRVLHQVAEYHIEVQDLSRHHDDELEQALQQYRDTLSHQCLDLQQWPAFDLRASRLPQAVRLHLSIDGLFLDFRSFQLLFQELLALYRNEAWQHVVPQHRFQDYVLSLEQLRHTQSYARAQRYWRNRLPRLPAAPALALAQDPATASNTQMVRREYRLSAAAWHNIKRYAADQGLTMAAVLLTAYGKVLARWSQEQRLTVNVPLFNRPSQYPELRQVIGNFSTFTLVPMDFSQPRTFVEEVRAVQQALHQAIEHSQVSGVQLLRDLAQQRGQLSGRAFPIVFTHLPTGLDDWDDSLLAQMEQGLGEVKYAITQTPQVWLDNQIWHENGGLRLHWDGLDSLFPPGLVDEMFAAYTGLLEQLSSARAMWREQRIDLLPSWQHQLLAVANMTQQDLPAGNVVDWIAARVQRDPRALAIVNGSERITYGDLLQRADQLAQVLHQRGIGRDGRVAVLLEKGWRQIVAVLGIQRCGAAYVPLDVSSPQARIETVLSDSAPDALIGDAHSLALLAWVPAYAISMDDAEVQQAPPQAPRVQRQPDDLAYVIYTSGTTGTPKGVMVSQHNLASLVAMTNRHFEVTRDDKLLALTALHHDLSVFDVFACLTVGGCLVMPDADKQKDPAHWLTLLKQESVTLWNSVPALLEMLLDYVAGNHELVPASLRQGWTGGDWVSTSLVQKSLRMAPQMQLCSIGGPTETTVWNIWYPVARNIQGLSKIPYGKPAPNNRYYVLNSAGEECPVWVTGELYCAGNGVALGYWNNAAETAQRFVPHPRTGERLYRCGDQGRWLPDGNIEFMGRSDEQIKLQGVRVETAEVEAALLHHCELDAAVVGTVGDGLNKRLAAWVVPKQKEQLLSSQLNSLLHQTGPVITDHHERAAFKLEQRGVRRLSGDATALPGRPNETDDKRQFLQRQSIRQFRPEPLTIHQLGNWLATLAQLKLDDQVLPKYRYPSGGGLYPVQAYLYLRRGAVQGLDAGYYYYQAQDHQLLRVGNAQAEPVYTSVAEDMVRQSAFGLWLVADLNAIEPLYGRLSRDFCLLEAGYMGQLLMAEAGRYEIGLCPLGYSDDQRLRQSLQLGRRHQVVHGLLGGAIAREQLNQWQYDRQPGRGVDKAPMEDQQAQVAQIHQRLRQHLPEALVPPHIIMMSALPLSRNGKVDRRALPRPDQAPVTTSPQTNNEPMTALQAEIAKVWRELLELEQVGLDDNFFAAGGNSNLLVQAHGRIQQAIGMHFAVTTLFQYPSVRQLADHLSPDDKDASAVDTDERGRRQREALRRQRERKARRYV